MSEGIAKYLKQGDSMPKTYFPNTAPSHTHGTGKASVSFTTNDDPPEVPIAVKQSVKAVTVVLNDYEKAQLGAHVADLLGQIELKKDELKTHTAIERAYIKTLEQTARTHAKALIKGYKEEPAPVEEHFDFNTSMVKTIYNGKVVSERPMTPEEMQLDLEQCLSMGWNLTVAKTGPPVKAVV